MFKIKKYLPYLVAIMSFIVVSMAYFAPQYSGGDVRKGDDIQALGMTGGINDHIQEYGEHPQWAPNMFSGMPTYLISMNYEGRLVKSFSDSLYFLGKPAAYYFILMAGFWFMLLCFGVNPLLAAVGAIAYGLSSYFIIIYEAGHITKLMALAFAAPLIGSIYYSYKKNLWIGASLAGILTAIQISTSHPQITYYFLFVIFGLIVAMAVNFYKSGKLASFWKRSLALLAAAILGVGANVVQLYYIQDYASDSIRGKSELTVKSDDNAHNHTSGLDKDYITAWSYGKVETLNLFIPNLYGGSSSGGFTKDGDLHKVLKKYHSEHMTEQMPAYWGPQPFTSGPVYIGAVIFFLAFFAIFLLNGWARAWLVSLTIFAMALAWGKNMNWLTDLFIDYFPMYNKFRTVSMILVIVQWSLPFLSILALQKVLTEEVDRKRFYNALRNSLIVCGGIALFFYLCGGFVFNFNSARDAAMKLPDDIIFAMQNDRFELMKGDSLRSFIFVLLSGVLLWAFFEKKIAKSLALILFATLVIADMVPVDLRFLNYDDFVSKKEARSIKPTSANLEILKDKDPNFRVANFTVSTFNDATTSYFHKSIGGYHAAKMRRYQDVIDRYLEPRNVDVYSMLNTKYFIVASREQQPFAMLNDKAFGNGWFVNEIKSVENADQEIAALGEVSLKDVAVVDRAFSSVIDLSKPLTADSLASVVLTDYKINHLTYKTSSKEDGVVVFSEIYYPKGWVAYIDGVEVPYFRANYLLRALEVPKGDHTVEFKFAAPHFKLLVGATSACSIILFLMLIGGVWYQIRKRKYEDNKE